MTYFSFRFLLCNAIICIFLGILLGLKRLLQNQLSARIQYNLSIIFLVVLIVPFFPNKVCPIFYIMGTFTNAKFKYQW